MSSTFDMDIGYARSLTYNQSGGVNNYLANVLTRGVSAVADFFVAKMVNYIRRN